MPICDGYKATHLLRYHVPYKAYIRDVPIVAMTASAIQGDQEKCRKAGMDDYLAKPVRSKTLERMLVRWSVNKRTIPTPHLSSSGTSDCSDESDNCTNAGIPCVGVDEDDDDGGRPAAASLGTGLGMEMELEESRSSLLTPRPTTSPQQSMFPLPSPGPGSTAGEPPTQSPSPHKHTPSDGASVQQQIRRVETDELAQQSRDDKLFDAAGGSQAERAAGMHTPLVHTPMIEKGDSLTEANVQKFHREELRRRTS